MRAKDVAIVCNIRESLMMGLEQLQVRNMPKVSAMFTFVCEHREKQSWDAAILGIRLHSDRGARHTRTQTIPGTDVSCRTGKRLQFHMPASAGILAVTQAHSSSQVVTVQCSDTALLSRFQEQAHAMNRSLQGPLSVCGPERLGLTVDRAKQTSNGLKCTGNSCTQLTDDSQQHSI